MASYLHYEIWSRRKGDLYEDDLVRDMLASGTITASGTLSAAVTVPNPVGSVDVVGVFEVYGTDPQYIHIRNQGAAVASGSSAHAAVDAQPRMLIRQENGPKSVNLPKGGSFAVVQAAAFS